MLHEGSAQPSVIPGRSGDARPYDRHKHETPSSAVDCVWKVHLYPLRTANISKELWVDFDLLVVSIYIHTVCATKRRVLYP